MSAPAEGIAVDEPFDSAGQNPPDTAGGRESGH
jgi:hypothetical protein